MDSILKARIARGLRNAAAELPLPTLLCFKKYGSLTHGLPCADDGPREGVHAGRP